jgi:hypothetical protein
LFFPIHNPNHTKRVWISRALRAYRTGNRNKARIALLMKQSNLEKIKQSGKNLTAALLGAVSWSPNNFKLFTKRFVFFLVNFFKLS